uniref:Uncharacterized protein n=1 Tax=Lates calcarifer TaxID=8187 RepID=A0A4W6E538_LATCA
MWTLLATLHCEKNCKTVCLSEFVGAFVYTHAQRNQTKLLETDKDSHHRPKRGWIWNQFFVLEEHIGPEPQYVGKVRYIIFLRVQLIDPRINDNDQ